jgi:hypothetical protein
LGVHYKGVVRYGVLPYFFSKNLAASILAKNDLLFDPKPLAKFFTFFSKKIMKLKVWHGSCIYINITDRVIFLILIFLLSVVRFYA